MTTPYYNAGDGNGKNPPVIPVVQGVEVKPRPLSFFKSSNNDTSSNVQTNQKQLLGFGEEEEEVPIPPKERRCQDAFWAVLFLAHIGAVAYLTILYAPQMLSDLAESVNNGDGYQQTYHGARRLYRLAGGGGRFLEEEDGGGNDEGEGGGNDEDLELDIEPEALLLIVCFSALISLLVSTFALGFMISFAEALVKLSLFFNVATFAILSLVSLLIGAFPTALLFGGLTAIMVFYTYRVWQRIPFAAANLVTAVTAVRANLGLALYAYIAVVGVFLWSMWWSVATLSTLYVTSGCQADGNCESEANAGIVFAFLLSYYWTVQVIGNVVHCSTAGTVGTWWYHPSEANGCCSRAVRDSYVRSLTLSFGSICLASLIVAIIQAIRELVHSLRDNGDSFIACCAECLLACIESLVELFNRFALVYVAVHGQSFLSAGRSVMDLFRARGWTTIITDYMVDTVLTMMSIGVGLLIGFVAVVIGAAMQASGQTLAVAFLVGLIVGYAVCATLLSVVSSAVNTVIVCYAEAPNDFQRNYPELSNNMRAAWRQAWPTEFSY